MAEAARSVRHYVSDCLEERHPYDIQKGFAGRPDRDAGRVFDGFLPDGIALLVSSLSDPSIEDPERAKAVHHLFAHSASQEKKIDILHQGVVGLTVSILNRQPFHLLEHQCFLLLRSLAVIPQGCFPIVECGGLEAALTSILNTDNAEERLEARTAAVHMTYQLSCNFAGLRWMMRAEDCEEFKLAGLSDPPSPTIIRVEDILDAMTFVLRTEPITSKISFYAMSTLANMTMLTPGILGVQQHPATVAVISKLMKFLSTQAEWKGSVALFLPALLATVWHLAMDQEGVELLEKQELPEPLFVMFDTMRKSPDAVSRLIQRHLMGALSAVYKLTSVKLKSVEPLGEMPSRVMAFISYLRGINDIVDALRKEKKPISADVIATSKNTVQCIRFASEVKGVRDITHRFINELDATNHAEAFYFRRQLYYSTAWAEEYEAFM